MESPVLRSNDEPATESLPSNSGNAVRVGITGTVLMRFYAWWATAVGWLCCLASWVIILGADSWSEIGWYLVIILVGLGASFLAVLLGLASLRRYQGKALAKWAPVLVNLPVLAHIYLFMV